MSITLETVRPVSPLAAAPAVREEGSARPEARAKEDASRRLEPESPEAAEAILQEAGREVEAELARSPLDVTVRASEERPGYFVIEVRDPEGGELIRQIPSEEALEAAQSLRDLRGLLLKQEG